jgi:hypothetical protein
MSSLTHLDIIADLLCIAGVDLLYLTLAKTIFASVYAPLGPELCQLFPRHW